MMPSAPASAAIISLDGSLRPRSISDRYWGEIPARSAVCASVSQRSAQRAQAAPEHLPPQRFELAIVQ